MAEGSLFDNLPANVPESVRAKIAAARLLQQGAAQQTAPYTSKAVVGLKALEGLMGGMQERSVLQDMQRGQMAGNASLVDLANALRNGTVAGGTPSAPTGGAAVGSDAVASGTARNPAGYDPKATEAMIRAKAPAYGIDPDTAVAIARSEGLNVYGGDKGSSFGPFQLHYGNVAGGGNAVGGLGDAFTKQTGLDARDPSTVPQQIDFALSQAAQGGWGPWHGRNTPGVNIGVWDGIGSNKTAAPTATASAAPSAPSGTIGDASALAASNRLSSGTGTDADRALLATYRQQQNTPPANRTAQADMPAPNAQVVSSPTLPPGVDPSMLGPGAPSSPFGAPPSAMAPPGTPSPAALAAALRGQGAGSGPGATPLPATVQPSSPFGAMPSSMAQPPATPPAGPMMAASPPPTPQPSPFGGPPQPMAAQGAPDPKMLAQLLAQGGAGGPTRSLAPQDPSVAAAPPTSAPQASPLSPNALAMGDLAPGGPGPAALDPSGAATAPLPATGLSTGSLPGFDNITPSGQVQQSSIGDSGFTGSDGAQPGTLYNTPGGPQDGSIVTALQGNLPPPQQMAMGASDLQAPPAPGAPSPAVLAAALRQSAPSTSPAPPPGPTPAPVPVTPPAIPPAPTGVDQNAGPAPIAALGATPDPSDVAGNATRAMQAAGMDTTGLPGAAASSPSVQAGLAKQTGTPLPAMAGANVPPPDLSGLAGPTTPPAGSGLPIMARQSSNPPAALQQDFAGLGQQPQPIAAYSTEPTSRPGAQAARNLAAGVPTPPPRPSNAALGLDPDAPAPGAVAAGPAPLTNPMARALAQQPMGLAGNSAVSDPSSPQNFMRQEAQRTAGGVSPSTLAAALRGQTSAPTASPASQSSDGPLDGIARLFGVSSPGNAQGGGLGGMLSNLPIIGNLVGGGQQPGAGPGGQAAGSSTYGGQGQGQTFTPGGQGGQPAAAQGGGQGAQVGGLSQARTIAGQILNNPYASPEAREAAGKVLFAQPTFQKLDNGDLYRIDPLGQSAPQLVARGGKFNAAHNGVIYNEATGLGPGQSADGTGSGAGSNSFRPMTQAERVQYGITDGRPGFMGPGGEPHFGMPETQGQGETAEAKTAGEGAAARRGDMIAGADAAPEKIARLNLLGAVLDKTQTGPLAPEVGNAASIAQRLGISNDRLSALGIDPNAPVNNAIANKLAGEMTMGSIGAKNGGMPASNFSVAERQFIEALYPNIENQAGGNRAVTDVLTAVEQRKLQTADAWSAYKDQQRQAGKPLSYEDFEDQFRQQHAGDNIFAPIIAKYQAGGYTPTVPTPGGVPNAAPGASAPQAASPPTASAAPPQPQGQPAGQGGGYLPGAARGPAAQPQAPQASAAIAQAQAAIAKGAPRAAVIQRLQSMGINPAGL